jgi:RAD51-like protein 3
MQVTTARELSHGVTFTYVSTGSNELDSLLGGGVRCGEILEISGPSGSGKTQLVMAMSVQCDGECTIVDTSHGICCERITEIATSCASLDSLQCIHISDIYDIFHFYDALENISSKTKLLVVDCVSTFIATEFGKGYAGQAAIENVTTMLRSISRDYNTAVVVTNGVVSDRRSKGKETKPALGRVWSFTPDRRVMLASSDDYQSPQQHGADFRFCLDVIPSGVCLR